MSKLHDRMTIQRAEQLVNALARYGLRYRGICFSPGGEMHIDDVPAWKEHVRSFATSLSDDELLMIRQVGPDCVRAFRLVYGRGEDHRTRVPRFSGRVC